MLELIGWTGSVGVREFWVPVLVWTSLAGVVGLGLRARAGGLLPSFSGTRLHPLAGYRLRQALLLALPASVLAAPWMPAVWGLETELPRPARFTAPGPAMAPPAPGEVPLAPDQAHAVETAATLFGAATVVIALLAIMRLTALAVDLRRLRTIRRAAPVVEDPMPQRLLGELAVRLGVRRPVNLLEGPPGQRPDDLRLPAAVVVVPRTALDSPGSLGTVLAHELIHIRRGDYCWALLESVTPARSSRFTRWPGCCTGRSSAVARLPATPRWWGRASCGPGSTRSCWRIPTLPRNSRRPPLRRACRPVRSH